MPNWKKVIVSGSDASLHSLNVSTSTNTQFFTASGLNYPTVDGTYESQVLQTNAIGTLSFGDVNTIYETVYNGEYTTLTKGTPVYVSGSNGANPKVYAADATDPTKMPVIFIVSEDITAGTAGRGISLGLITGIDLTGYTAGTEVFVAAGGGWTSTRPTGSAIVQILGIITKPGNGGQGLVLNPGPIDLPNLNPGNLWVGDSSAYPVAVATSSLSVASSSYSDFALTASYALNGGGSGGGATTGSNVFEGDQIISGSLVVTGSITGNVILTPATASNIIIPTGYNGLLISPLQMQGSSSVAIGSKLTIL